MSQPLHFEPREASSLDFYAAHASASGVRAEHEDRWPGQVEEIRATEPNCTVHRKYMERASEATCHGLADKGKRDPKPAPRVPRDYEPAHLHVVLALLVFVVTCVALVAGSMLHGLGWLVGELTPYADAFVVALAKWVGGVL